MTERVIRVAGLDILHREAGEGIPLLCLHGFPQTGYCWRGLVDPLSDRFRLLMPDVPGFGGSDAPLEHDAGVVADILCQYLDAVEATSAVVMGHDWGGAFAFRMALDHQDRVSHLVITNSPFREMSLWRAWYVMFFNLPVLPELSFRAFSDKLIAGALTGGSTRKEGFDTESVRVYQDAYATPERVRSALAYYRTVTRRSLQKQIRGRLRGKGGLRPTGLEGEAPRRIVAPTLLVWGMDDPVLTPALLPGIKRDIPQAEVVEVHGCGHFLPEERPEELARAIRAFVA